MLFIFDWDGTLCDSLERIIVSAQRAAGDFQLPVPESNEVRSIVGLGLVEAMRSLFPAVNEEQHQSLAECYRQHFLNLGEELPSALYPGVLDTLEKLRSENHRFAIATGKSRIGLDLVLKEVGLEKYFDASRCADETQSKPHPQMLYELLQELDHKAEDTLMVGDTEFDLMMAQAAGVRAIGVSYGAHPLERLQKCNPHLIVERFSYIRDHF